MKFVILAAPRTGSNMLCTLLQSHPDVLCHHEVFNPDGIFMALPLRESSLTLGSIEDRENSPLEFLERIWKNTLGHKKVGFKMTHRQQPQVLAKVCADPSIHKIVLKRKAQLKTYVSRLIAERSGIWEDYKNQDIANKHHNTPITVEVDYWKLKSAINYNEEFYSELDNSIYGFRTDLYYEDICTLDKCTRQNILASLDLSDYPISVSSRKQNSKPLNQLINNYDSLLIELRKHCSDSLLLSELKSI